VGELVEPGYQELHVSLPTELAPDEIFVFGSNEGGFHGAGAAGLACRGDARVNWRLDQWFRGAMKAPAGSPDRVGRWAVFGVGRGLQEGRDGLSYAVATVTRPGARRSVSLRDIYYQLVELWKLVKARPHLTFLIAPLGEGYAGYSAEEMEQVWQCLFERHGRPDNVRFVGRDEGVKAT
jgi:hypothetical protein